MIIDAHTHIFWPEIKQDRSGYFKNEPEFSLLYDSPRSTMCTVEDLIESMDAQNVDVSVVCGFPWRTPDFAIKNNDVVIDAVARFPDRIKGLACFDTGWDKAAEETERCIDAGLSGAGELAFYLSGIDQKAIASLSPIMAILRKKGNLPCMIHTNEPVGHQYSGKTPVTLEQIYQLAKAFPENRLILAHWGGGIFFYNILKKEAKTVFRNTWFDTAASLFLYDPQIYDIAMGAGLEDKILFGTDYPLLPPERYYQDIDKSNISNSQKEKILGENARMLFSI